VIHCSDALPIPFGPVPSTFSFRKWDTREKVVGVVVTGDIGTGSDGGCKQERVELCMPSSEAIFLHGKSGKCQRLQESSVWVEVKTIGCAGE
jgi:hypothetical protein